MNGNQRSPTNQRIKNANNAGRCTGKLDVKCVRKLFD
jgi:hypothetical protein